MNHLEKICKQFKWFYKNGYITSRDGNACVAAGENFIVTASGVAKHKMVPSHTDFVNVDKDGNPFHKDLKPSIETGAHMAALKLSGRKASIHVHSPNTVALAALFEKGIVSRAQPTTSDLVTVLNTKWPELFRYTKVGYVVPFLLPGSAKLHESIVDSLTYWDDVVVGYDEEGEPNAIEEKRLFKDIVIMQHHGVLAIGNDLDECMDHIVRLEHISTILLKIITASGSLESIL